MQNNTRVPQSSRQASGMPLESASACFQKPTIPSEIASAKSVGGEMRFFGNVEQWAAYVNESSQGCYGNTCWDWSHYGNSRGYFQNAGIRLVRLESDANRALVKAAYDCERSFAVGIYGAGDFITWLEHGLHKGYAERLYNWLSHPSADCVYLRQPYLLGNICRTLEAERNSKTFIQDNIKIFTQVPGEGKIIYFICKYFGTTFGNEEHTACSQGGKYPDGGKLTIRDSNGKSGWWIKHNPKALLHLVHCHCDMTKLSMCDKEALDKVERASQTQSQLYAAQRKEK